MKKFLNNLPKFLFFTGKGGVGKTSIASSTAAGLADLGRKVLLISTDPASNLDEIFATKLNSIPTPVKGVERLSAMNINPIIAANEYRERMVAPYRGILPEVAIKQIEEQLSGGCTVEIAGFNEFSKFVGDESVNAEYDHVILDTAPTGHTLRLLNLPAAWNEFIAENQTGSSCLGPVSGLADQKILFAKVLDALQNGDKTLLVLVTRAEALSFKEASRASHELYQAGLQNQHLIINGVFASDSKDEIAFEFARQAKLSLNQIPSNLKKLPLTVVPFRPSGVMGVAAMRQLISGEQENVSLINREELQLQLQHIPGDFESFNSLVDKIAAQGHGVVMTMGKGGVGKTTIASLVAMELARRGHEVVLTTTDPAAHVDHFIEVGVTGLTVEKIDPVAERDKYVASVIGQNRTTMSPENLALLEEEMRSPCIEEIAVFRAFARTVAMGKDKIVVFDTAPTGHTLLLLDSTQSYHREVAKSEKNLPEEVKELLPRIRDPRFTRILIVTLPEATPVHEAASLQQDLQRAGIEPFAWVLNRSFAASKTEDPYLCAKGAFEIPYIKEVASGLSQRRILFPWSAELIKDGRTGFFRQFDQINQTKPVDFKPSESGAAGN